MFVISSSIKSVIPKLEVDKHNLNVFNLNEIIADT